MAISGFLNQGVKWALSFENGSNQFNAYVGTSFPEDIGFLDLFKFSEKRKILVFLLFLPMIVGRKRDCWA